MPLTLSDKKTATKSVGPNADGNGNDKNLGDSRFSRS